MASKTVDYRVSTIVVLCKDCGEDVGLYPARHQCKGFVRPPLPALPLLIEDPEADAAREAMEKASSPPKDESTLAAWSSALGRLTGKTTDANSHQNTNAPAPPPKTSDKKDELDEMDDNSYLDYYAALLPEAKKPAPLDGKKLWARAKQNDALQQLVDKVDKQKQQNQQNQSNPHNATTLWGKLFTAKQKLQEQGPDSDDSDLDAETPVSRTLRQYHENKYGQLPSWWAASNGGNRSDAEDESMDPAMDLMHDDRNDKVYQNLQELKRKKSQRLWEQDPMDEMSAREKERAALRDQERRQALEQKQAEEEAQKERERVERDALRERGRQARLQRERDEEERRDRERAERLERDRVEQERKAKMEQDRQEAAAKLEQQAVEREKEQVRAAAAARLAQERVEQQEREERERRARLDMEERQERERRARADQQEREDRERRARQEQLDRERQDKERERVRERERERVAAANMRDAMARERRAADKDKENRQYMDKDRYWKDLPPKKHHVVYTTNDDYLDKDMHSIQRSKTTTTRSAERMYTEDEEESELVRRANRQGQRLERIQSARRFIDHQIDPMDQAPKPTASRSRGNRVVDFATDAVQHKATKVAMKKPVPVTRSQSDRYFRKYVPTENTAMSATEITPSNYHMFMSSKNQKPVIPPSSRSRSPRPNRYLDPDRRDGLSQF